MRRATVDVQRPAHGRVQRHGAGLHATQQARAERVLDVHVVVGGPDHGQGLGELGRQQGVQLLVGAQLQPFQAIVELSLASAVPAPDSGTTTRPSRTPLDVAFVMMNLPPPDGGQLRRPQAGQRSLQRRKS